MGRRHRHRKKKGRFHVPPAPPAGPQSSPPAEPSGVPARIEGAALEETPPLEVEAVPMPQPSRKERRAMRAQLTITSEHHAGPLPHPDILAKYDAVHPGAARMIL